MDGHEEQPGAGDPPARVGQQPHPEQWAALQVEGTEGRGAQPFHERLVALVRGGGRELEQLERALLGDLLPGALAVLGEGRAQRRMPCHQRFEREPEGRAVERALDPRRAGQVVGEAPRRQAVDEPECLLVVGEREAAGRRPQRLRPRPHRLHRLHRLRHRARRRRARPRGSRGRDLDERRRGDVGQRGAGEQVGDRHLDPEGALQAALDLHGAQRVETVRGQRLAGIEARGGDPQGIRGQLPQPGLQQLPAPGRRRPGEALPVERADRRRRR